MDKKGIIKIIIILSVLLLLCILIIMKKGISKEKTNEGNIEKEQLTEIKIDTVKTYEEYVAITNIIATYYGYIAENDQNAIRGIINKEYLKNNNIEEINSKDVIFNVNEMNVQNNGELKIYYIYGEMKENLDSKEVKNVYFQVYLDDKNTTFEILPIDKKMYNKILNEKTILEVKDIDKNSYNEVLYLDITDETKATFIFNSYSKLLKGNIEKSYNLLDEEYKNKKFNTIENYKKYLLTKEGIDFSILSEFDMEEEEDYTKYTCIDQNGNKFIFKEISVMNYTVMFDDYVIPTPEFIEKYNSTTEQGKTILNIDKFFKALEDKSYYYAYNCLSEGFRNNYFKTLEDFEEYVNQNLYSSSHIEYEEFEKDGELCKYTINIIGLEQEEAATQKTIIMKLNEGTDFEMSFNIN